MAASIRPVPLSKLTDGTDVDEGVSPPRSMKRVKIEPAEWRNFIEQNPHISVKPELCSDQSGVEHREGAEFETTPPCLQTSSQGKVCSSKPTHQGSDPETNPVGALKERFQNRGVNIEYEFDFISSRSIHTCQVHLFPLDLYIFWHGWHHNVTPSFHFFRWQYETVLTSRLVMVSLKSRKKPSSMRLDVY